MQVIIYSTTHYINGFPYFDNVLQFFPTPEGYVKNTPALRSVLTSEQHDCHLPLKSPSASPDAAPALK